MNIAQAKEDIRKTILAYTAKTPSGTYRIPSMRQRPVFLMGPPGIGKTAVMAQIAAECGIGLVSYTMTHHTRQSAIGLPVIEQEAFGGKSFAVTQYTMSEIIASVYRQMEQTGLTEGILFLDEINCVSETLLPAILQLLQYKSFGVHRLPEGWVIVAAGNQPRYNQSAKEFDTAIMDRMKVLEIEPDLNAWKPYASNQGIHPAVLTYLTMNPSDFYAIQAGKQGRSFVTARGWEDLSDMLSSLEALNLTVEDNLFPQYLRHQEIAERFSLFYRLFQTYKDRKDLSSLALAPFEERLSVVLFMASSLQRQADSCQREANLLSSLGYLLENAASAAQTPAARPDVMNLNSPFPAEQAADSAPAALRRIFDGILQRREKAMTIKKEAGLLSPGEEEQELLLAKELKGLFRDALSGRGWNAEFSGDSAGILETMKELLRKRRERMDNVRDTLLTSIRTDLGFVRQTLGEGQELFIFSTELYDHRATHDLIRRYAKEIDLELKARLDLKSLKERILSD